jgi:hypothetical protein
MASLFSLMTPHVCALGPTISAMETRVHAIAFVLVVSIVLGGFLGWFAFGVYFLTVLNGLQR